MKKCSTQKLDMDHIKGFELLFGLDICERKEFSANSMGSNQGECKDMHHQIIYGLLWWIKRVDGHGHVAGRCTRTTVH